MVTLQDIRDQVADPKAPAEQKQALAHFFGLAPATRPSK